MPIDRRTRMHSSASRIESRGLGSSTGAAIALVALVGASVSADRALAGSVGGAEAASETATNASIQTIVVTAKVREDIGTQTSASAGVVGGIELSQRPILRQGELLEAVPGMIVTAHTSGGKANQYYLRGFNLDHGTDFSTSVDGVPVNLGTHAHGQGYMDLNWLIPELVAGVAYRKGPYYAEAGDFSAAGSAQISYLSSVTRPFVQVEAGTDDYGRLLTVGSAAVGPGTLLYAAEYIHYDGPYEVRGDYRRPNGVVKYTLGDAVNGGGVTVQGYDARWLGSDQLPVRAFAGLPGGRYGSLDPTGGGHTYRYSGVGEWHWTQGNTASQVEVYAVKYGLNLYSDFSYFIDQVNGDQFRQYDNRAIVGASAKTVITSAWIGQRTEDTFGLQTRSDYVSTELDHTAQRRLLEVYRTDQSIINSGALYWSNTTTWTPWLQTSGGVRLEAYHFHLDSNTAANSGETSLLRPAPKIGVTLSPDPTSMSICRPG